MGDVRSSTTFSLVSKLDKKTELKVRPAVYIRHVIYPCGGLIVRKAGPGRGNLDIESGHSEENSRNLAFLEHFKVPPESWFRFD